MVMWTVPNHWDKQMKVVLQNCLQQAAIMLARTSNRDVQVARKVATTL